MKKLVAMFILGAMLVTVGVGCGGATSSKAPEKKDTTPPDKKTGT